MLKNANQKHTTLILKAMTFIFILWAANVSYGFLHEAAHAITVKMLGGQVYEIYVNPLGTDAYTVHSSVSGVADTLSLEVAGMAMTTLLAFITLLSDYKPIPIFMAMRTAIYALNYSPGTDIHAIQQAIGAGAILVTALLVALNLACAAIAMTAMIKSAKTPTVKAFSSSLGRVLHQNSS
ncbi:hypothetical protein [Methanocella conradii]|uniref:hypothetical protein n=1 Tax=Methanocella conradii TaxID=1175444 RepID=UPI0024B37862|nr:hypothetical protein [Methanocella conradii]MDI6896175.1 hypothetical protein [Methanocella conradii]